MKARETFDLLRRYESPNVTFIEKDESWPIVWERARGVHVWDSAGKKYLDLTAGFGVCAAGHANSRVIKAGQRQMARLLHAMGDVHPHARKGELARELSRITFQRWSGQPGRTILCNSGFEAVEAALKTALLATGKRGIVAFEGAYHGLGYGALNATHRALFRRPFTSQLGGFGRFIRYPTDADEIPIVRRAVEKALSGARIGAVLVEPVQGRGGIRVPPRVFLPMLRELCDRAGALLVVDEIYTGFARTGRWFACEHSGAIPDLICLGKALAGGFPISACVGRAELIERAWPASKGEAIHTSTFLGHPVGCAMALAQIREVEARRLDQRSAERGAYLLQLLGKVTNPDLILEARGLGLMAGLELKTRQGQPATIATFNCVKEMLRLGFILLPEGEHGNVIGFTPPLIIAKAQLHATVNALKLVLRNVA
ncbi:MAG: aspartate aminotransferase family protein [Verrucomicrobia subdivision 3 bacterium]|nr:aspartate aminotransferase family protein [Limisphaerales bacterium]